MGMEVVDLLVRRGNAKLPGLDRAGRVPLAVPLTSGHRCCRPQRSGGRGLGTHNPSNLQNIRNNFGGAAT